ncbi:tRNA lysidine(34) synthetase TilS [Aerococcaceae bacterium DSM 111176]|nr:tRNA lysidine(34) synthetase TilS [Aerococcaceae bacterium DSM 111176]
MNVNKHIEDQIRQELSETDKPIVIAVSGGVDSICLLNMVIEIAKEKDFLLENLVIAHFNHQLRSTSDQEADYIEQYAKQMGLTYFISHWENNHNHSENAARTARYEFFADVLKMTRADCLLTAHHKDDNAETMLMRIIRGTSIKGMQGITSRSERYLKTSQGDNVRATILRPLIEATKEELYDYADKHSLTYFEDVTNSQMTYFRNRVRHQILPQMQTENPKITDSLHQLSKNLTISYQAHLEHYQQYEPQIVTLIGTNEWVLSIDDYQQLTENMKWVFLTLFFEERLVDVIPNYRKDIIEQLAHIIEQTHAPHASLDLGNNFSAKREYDFVYITRNKLNEDSNGKNRESVEIHELNKWYKISQFERVGIFHSHQVTSNLMLEATSSIGLSIEPTVMLPLVLRHRQPGDRIQLGGRGAKTFHKKISRIMIDEKIPQRQREACWLLLNQEQEILALLPDTVANNAMIDRSNFPQFVFLYQKI